MLALTKSKHTPIGIDIREEAVYAAQYWPAERASSRLSCARIPIDSTDGHVGTIQALQAMRSDFAFAGNLANISIGNADVDIRKLLLPKGVVPSDTLEFQIILRREARSLLTYEPEEALLDYLPLGHDTIDGEEHFAILLIAARREPVHHRLALLGAAGIQCTHLEPSSCAIIRAVSRNERVTAILDFDQHGSTVSIVRESKLLFSRSFKFGMCRVVDDLAEAMDTTPEDARLQLEEYGIRHDAGSSPDVSVALWSGKLDTRTLAAGAFDATHSTLEELLKEVRRSIEYFAHHIRGGNVEEIMVVSSVKIPGLEDYLAAQLSLPIKRRDFWSQTIADGLRHEFDDSSYAGAIGLAMRGSHS